MKRTSICLAGCGLVALLGAPDAVRGDAGCATYLVFATPLESPDLGRRTSEVCPADALASPFGWHDTDGAPGAESTETVGNNAIAQEDRDGDNLRGFRPDGGAELDFQFPLDLDLPPIESIPASVTHGFYWINLLHDVRWRAGFDEASGNFQTNNYDRGGAGGDPVTIDVQDPVGGAFFSTPPDGFAPGHLQLPEISPVENVELEVVQPSSIAGTYPAARGDWGGDLATPVSGLVATVDDGTGTGEGCDRLVGFEPGQIALIERGSCEFGEKALNAEDAGAIAALIINDSEELFEMDPGQFGADVAIPAILVRQSDGTTLREALPGVEIELRGSTAVLRDGVYDNTVVAHAVGHGVSTRLAGGPGNSFCLTNAEQMGEGWSDFDALWYTSGAAALPEEPRSIGAYSLFSSPGEPGGLRQFPYSTDLTIDPRTYADLPGQSVPFGVGGIWASMLWEVYWNLVDKHGYDPDLYEGSGGNQIALRLVTDALKLQPCLPHFVDGRDAILDADLIASGGADRCEIWRGFAKRGLGLSADAGTSSSIHDGTPAFDLPIECGPTLDRAGSCPGVLTLRAAGLLPGSSLLVSGSELGVSTVPSGPCAGTPLAIADARPVALGPTDPDGTRTLERSVSETRCGAYVQIVDAGCRVSDVVQLPMPRTRPAYRPIKYSARTNGTRITVTTSAARSQVESSVHR